MTFLFTDIEGSTRLWESFPLVMQQALVRHDTILRQQIEQYGGRVFKTVGDAFCAVFPDAGQALTASLAIQEQLAAEPWGETGPLRVRMGLHSGIPSERDGDYFGPPVNCVARLLSAGHGGQILVSGAVEEQIRNAVPHGVTLQDMGTHRLRDVQLPIRIFQANGAGLPVEFAALKTLEYDPHNIPAQVTSFVGRHRELETVVGMLREPGVRLLTLTGPGGVGKTRLALQAAMTMREAFPDGRYLVPLASLIDPAAVVGTIARELGIQETAGMSDLECIVAFLRDKTMLLVLDNFEHVLAATDVVVHLLEQCSHLHLLVTSRIGLHVYGEHEYAVSPFQVPDLHKSMDLARIGTFEAVSLFLDRARSVRGKFELTAQNAATVAEICVRLDGLPLAIELAAARSKLLSPQALLDRLTERLTFLQGRTRGLPERQQTIRSTIRWSYDLLNPPEQALFRWLTVFAGGFTIDSAEQVVSLFQDTSAYASAPLVPDVAEGIAVLIDNSLIQIQETASGEPRLLILETLREFGHEQMRQSSEMDALQVEHAAWCIDLAIEARKGYATPQESESLDRLEAEHDNLRSALTWLGRHGGNPGQTQSRLAANLWWYWLYRRYISEGREWLNQALEMRDGVTAQDRADALNGAGVLAHMQADNRVAVKYFEECLAMRRISGTARDLASVLNNLGNVKRTLNEFDEAVGYFEEAAEVARNGGELRILGTMLSNLGNIYYQTGEYDRAMHAHREALAVQESQGNARGATTTRGNLADTYRSYGRLEEARELYLQVANDFCAMNDARSAAQAWVELGEIACIQGDLPSASSYVDRAIPEFAKDGALDSLSTAKILEAKIALRRGDANVARQLLLDQIGPVSQMDEEERYIVLIEWLARTAHARGENEAAARWFAATGALRERLHLVPMPVEAVERTTILQAIRESLGEPAWEDQRQVGVRLDVHACLAEAQAGSIAWVHPAENWR